jgi:hypothetical protein
MNDDRRKRRKGQVWSGKSREDGKSRKRHASPKKKSSRRIRTSLSSSSQSYDIYYKSRELSSSNKYNPVERECVGTKVKEEFVSESEKRRDHRHRQKKREEESSRRESRGKKPYYLMVIRDGHPYGEGVNTWRAEVNKLAIALDPSVMDIRQQPHEDIMIVVKRLADNFEYSRPLSEEHLRGILGKQVMNKRHVLYNSIKAGAQIPPGMDEKVWKRLKKIIHNPVHVARGKRMQYANSCRKTLRRTCPFGEHGIHERLRGILCRSPDSEEIHEEMNRPKGSAPGKRVKKLLSRKDSSESEEGGSSDKDSRGGSKQRQDRVEVVRERKGATKYDDDFVESLIKRLEMLEGNRSIPRDSELSGKHPTTVTVAKPPGLAANEVSEDENAPVSISFPLLKPVPHILNSLCLWQYGRTHLVVLPFTCQ